MRYHLVRTWPTGDDDSGRITWSELLNMIHELTDRGYYEYYTILQCSNESCDSYINHERQDMLPA